MSSEPAGEQQVRPGLLIVLGVIVGVGALLALYSFVIAPLLAGDDDDGEPDVTIDVDVEASPSAEPTEGATEAPDELDPDELGDQDLFPDIDADPVPETFEIFTARDPFQQLVVQAGSGETAVVAPADGGAATADTAAGATTPATGSTQTPGTTTGTGTGTGTGGTAQPPAANPDTGATGSGSSSGSGATGTNSVAPGGSAAAPQSASVDGTRIRLNDVFSGSDGVPTLIVSVNGTTYEVKEGEVFAQRFQVLAIDGLCATFLFGDSRFVLCEGESIVK